MLMNLVADFEEAERIEVAGIVRNVFENSREEAGAQDVLVGLDQFGGIESEVAGGFLGDERVIIDLGKALRSSHFAHFMVEDTLGVFGGYAGGGKRRDGRDIVVADHAADFFDQ